MSYFGIIPCEKHEMEARTHSMHTRRHRITCTDPESCLDILLEHNIFDKSVYEWIIVRDKKISV
jgi:hypothetical protein